MSFLEINIGRVYTQYCSDSWAIPENVAQRELTFNIILFSNLEWHIFFLLNGFSCFNVFFLVFWMFFVCVCFLGLGQPSNCEWWALVRFYRCQVTGETRHMTCDLWHKTCETFIFSFFSSPFLSVSVRLVFVLLSAHVKRFSVSRIQDSSSLLQNIY